MPFKLCRDPVLLTILTWHFSAHAIITRLRSLTKCFYHTNCKHFLLPVCGPQCMDSMRMRPIATDVAWSIRRCVCVCLLDTLVSSAKRLEGIEMSFVMCRRVSPKHALDWLYTYVYTLCIRTLKFMLLRLSHVGWVLFVLPPCDCRFIQVSCYYCLCPFMNIALLLLLFYHW